MGTKIFLILLMLEAVLFLQKVGFALATQVQATICPASRVPWTNLDGGYCYFLERRRMGFDAASQNCVSKGGSLASLHSVKEVDLVRRMFASLGHEDSPYIGLQRLANGKLKWSDGSTVDFENWSSLPTASKDNCATMGYFTGNWYLVSCNLTASSLCSTPKRIPCEPNICKSGGYCTKDGINDLFPCKCRSGFQGLTCSERITCNHSPCKNGGTCKPDAVGGAFSCSCPHGYEGGTCATRITCHEHLCKNGGSCSYHPVEGVFRCDCARGFKGVTCEERDNVLTIVFICLGVLLLLIISITLFFGVRRYRRQTAPDPKQLQTMYMKTDNEPLDLCHMNILDEGEEDNR